MGLGARGDSHLHAVHSCRGHVERRLDAHAPLKWGQGCILGELMGRKVMFKGGDFLDQCRGVEFEATAG